VPGARAVKVHVRKNFVGVGASETPNQSAIARYKTIRETYLTTSRRFVQPWFGKIWADSVGKREIKRGHNASD
jgi:hypothetical protein